MYEALGIKDIDKILPPPAPIAPKDPALEHIDALAMKPFSSISWSRPQSTHYSPFKFHGN